ncbi:hypothetical protein [Alkalihalophilus pseudofirmus]|nr:hypothetical protein [Alkalihalophilus pseudofirmus]
MKPILREEVRSYFIYKPHLRSAYSDINQINNTDFGSEVLKHSIDDLRKSVEKLESIPLENVPIEIFGDFYEVLGEMQYVSKTGSDILLTKKHSVHLRNAVKNEVYPDIEMKLDRLIDNYSEYIDTAIQKLK